MPVDFALVRNHALVDDVELLIADDPVLLRNLRPFTGSIAFEPEDEGKLEEGDRASTPTAMRRNGVL